jgi:hypothetical protein
MCFFRAANEKKAIEAMFDREQKQEKNLEIRERDLKRAKALEVDAQKREVCNSKRFFVSLRRIIVTVCHLHVLGPG